jgi:hypothetical protein
MLTESVDANLRCACVVLHSVLVLVVKLGMSQVQTDQGNILDSDPDNVWVSIDDCISVVEVVHKLSIDLVS